MLITKSWSHNSCLQYLFHYAVCWMLAANILSERTVGNFYTAQCIQVGHLTWHEIMNSLHTQKIINNYVAFSRTLSTPLLPIVAVNIYRPDMCQQSLILFSAASCSSIDNKTSDWGMWLHSKIKLKHKLPSTFQLWFILLEYEQKTKFGFFVHGRSWECLMPVLSEACINRTRVRFVPGTMGGRIFHA